MLDPFFHIGNFIFLSAVKMVIERWRGAELKYPDGELVDGWWKLLEGSTINSNKFYA
jgi:hypothetical protein